MAEGGRRDHGRDRATEKKVRILAVRALRHGQRADDRADAPAACARTFSSILLYVLAQQLIFGPVYGKNQFNR